MWNCIRTFFLFFSTICYHFTDAHLTNSCSMGRRKKEKLSFPLTQISLQHASIVWERNTWRRVCEALSPPLNNNPTTFWIRNHSAEKYFHQSTHSSGLWINFTFNYFEIGFSLLPFSSSFPLIVFIHHHFLLFYKRFDKKQLHTQHEH